MRKWIQVVLTVCLSLTLVACNYTDANNEFYFEYAIWQNPNQMNIFSSKDHYIQKDLIANGVAKENWEISERDLTALKTLLDEYNAKDITTIDANSYLNGETIEVSSSVEEFYIKFRLDGVEHTIQGDTSIFDVSGENADAKKMCDFLDSIEGILYKQTVYLNMPEAEGSYH